MNFVIFVIFVHCKNTNQQFTLNILNQVMDSITKAHGHPICAKPSKRSAWLVGVRLFTIGFMQWR